MGIAILIAGMLFFAGVIAIDFLKDSVTQARIDAGCSGTLTDGGKVLCLVIDGVIPYFILILLSTAGGLVISRFLI